MKFIIALILAFIGSVFTTAALSQTIGLHCCSMHDPDPGNYANNGNIGAYVRFDNGATIGGYLNSFKRDTFYAGWTSPEWNRLSVSLVAATGYIRPGINPDKETNIFVKALGQAGLVPAGILSARILSVDCKTLAYRSEDSKSGVCSARLGYIPISLLDPKAANITTLMFETHL